MKAMIFAAGFGTRLKPFTDKHPKALFKVNGIALLERNIKYLKSFGIRSFVINIHYLGEQIIDFLEANNNFDCEIIVSDERDKILETGGGMLKAKNLLKDDDFLMMNADILTDLKINQLIEAHKNTKALATLAVMDRESSRKLRFDNINLLCGWENVKTKEVKIAREVNEFTLLAFSGIQVLSPTIFKKIQQTNVFSIIETYLELAREEAILGFNHQGSKFIDVGKIESVKKAEQFFQ